jgi:hypothetical protein
MTKETWPIYAKVSCCLKRVFLTKIFMILPQIVHWFFDELSARAPFSIHRIALLGKQLGKNIGEWFGPSTIGQVIQ